MVDVSLTAAFPLRLSQGQLNLLTTCPRKYQYLVLEQRGIPDPLEQQERFAAGSRFHLLMQQWELGLAIAPLLAADPQLQQWFNQFIQAAGEILSLDDATQPVIRQSEQERTLEFQGYLLTVVYDLLLTNSQQARIIDWKTYPRPQNPHWLMQNWQSRLYPFVLAESGEYTPEQISMVYWFFQTNSQSAENQPQCLPLPYTTRQHGQTRQDLSRLLATLSIWLANYSTSTHGKPTDFPKLPPDSPVCQTCQFASTCHTSCHTYAPSGSPVLTDLSRIEEVPL